MVDAPTPRRAPVAVTKNPVGRLRSATILDVIENSLHQYGRDRLPSQGSSFLTESNQTVLDVEVLDGQVNDTAAATGCFDEQS